METRIRRATPADAAALAELGAATFVETFGHLYLPDDLHAFLAQSHGKAAYAKLLAQPGHALWLAERKDVAVGYVQAATQSALPHPQVRPGEGELKRLYLRHQAQSLGIGSMLMDVAMDWLLRDGPRTLWLSVYSENRGAQRFYARRGFMHVGEYHFVVGQQHDREFIYRRPAPP